MASMGLNLDEQKAVDRFRKEVVDPSRTKLVILDFWAEWCGPCKALTPVLEKVAAEYADKGVVLAKLNVDEEQFIAAQFQVRSIPTVYAMFQGQPVADLTNARTESQLREMLDQLLGQLPIVSDAESEAAQEIAPLIAMGEEALANDDAMRGLTIFSRIAEMDPDNPAIWSGLIRALLATNQLDQAKGAYESLPDDLRNDPLLQQVGKAIELADSGVEDSELQNLRAAAVERPADLQAQFDFAQAAFAAGSRDEAADSLLRIIAADQQWQDGAAKAKLLQIFEVVGLEDPWVTATRRRLSLLLFG